MKISKLIYIPLLLLSLTSCNPTPSIPDPAPSVPSTSFEELTTTEVSHGTQGGMLIEINMNHFLFPNEEYVCTYAPSHVNPEFRVTSSHENVLTIKKDTEDISQFTITTHTVGDSIVSIYDVDDMLVYRHVLRVRPKYTPEELIEVCFNYDRYKGNTYLGNHTIVFTSSDTMSGIFTGSDDFEKNMRYEFVATYVEYNESFKAYLFSIETTKRDETTTTKLSEMLISPCGDFIALYTSSDSMLNLFFPVELSNIHPEII